MKSVLTYNLFQVYKSRGILSLRYIAAVSKGNHLILRGNINLKKKTYRNLLSNNGHLQALKLVTSVTQMS